MRVFSGVQPTSQLHIGNYLGAIKQWVSLQKNNDCLFCVVDLHSLTVPYDPKKLPKRILETATVYLAAGINPEKSIIFVQSHVKEHSELCWLLSTIAPVGELKRMVQFKEKAKKYKENVNMGLMNYPVLMAADILLYQARLVPVGKDQEQHLELTRYLAQKFNQRFGPVFTIPEVLIPKEGAKIMSLTDPTKKMSKSDPPKSRVSLFDSPEEIRVKIMRASTDSGKEIKYDPERKPGISNLLTIYSLFSEEPISILEKKFQGKGYQQLKKELAEFLIERLKPFREARRELEKNPQRIKMVLKQGAERARVLAKATMKKVKSKMGLSF